MALRDVSLEDTLNFLEKNTSDQKFQIAYGLIRHQDSWRLMNCVINFLGPADREPLEYLYGDHVALVREIIPGGLAERIREIIDANSFQVGKFSLSEALSATGPIGHQESGRETSYLGGQGWPFFSLDMSLTQRLGGSFWETMVSEDLPVFPGRDAAMNYLTGFKKESWEYIPGVMAPLQDFRGRVDHVNIDESLVEVQIDSQLKSTNLIVKIYAESDKDIALLEKSGVDQLKSFKFDCPTPLKTVAVALLEKGSEMPIDAAEWSLQRPSRKFEVKGGTALESLLTQGESETVEYKLEIDRNDKEEFVETISSFANTSGGLMILGVNDNLEVLGFQRKREDIARIIDDRIDPTPPYRIEETNYRNKRLLLVYVEKGTRPPYMSTRTKKAYGRRRANDYYLSSAEIRDRVTASIPTGEPTVEF